MKKIHISSKPSNVPGRYSPDEWVSDRHLTESLKRLTVDVPLELHKRIKSQCAIRNVKMADEIRELLEKHFSQEDKVKRSGDTMPNEIESGNQQM
jgi:hypothetical protein